MFRWLLRLFSRRDEPLKTTADYRDFAIAHFITQKLGEWESEESRMCRYIIEKKKSPFKGDKKLKHARALLIKNGIDPDKVL